MKAKVVITNIFIDGKKYRRGDVVEVDDVNKFGAKLETVIEAPKPIKKKVAKKKAAKKVEDGED